MKGEVISLLFLLDAANRYQIPDFESVFIFFSFITKANALIWAGFFTIMHLVFLFSFALEKLSRK